PPEQCLSSQLHLYRSRSRRSASSNGARGGVPFGRPVGDAEALAAIILLEYGTPPGVMGKVPGHRAAQPAFECLGRTPAEIASDLARVDGVAVVVARAVRHEGDEPRVRSARRAELIQRPADCRHHLQIGALAAPADIVGLSG